METLKFLMIAAVAYLLGSTILSIPLPELMRGSVDLGVRTLPAHRVFVIFAGLGVLARRAHGELDLVTRGTVEVAAGQRRAKTISSKHGRVGRWLPVQLPRVDGIRRAVKQQDEAICMDAIQRLVRDPGRNVVETIAVGVLERGDVTVDHEVLADRLERPLAQVAPASVALRPPGRGVRNR
jgi:hypothetical protein